MLFGPREAVDSPVQVSAIGQGIFRVYRFQEGALKLLPCSLMKKPQPAFTAHAWIIEGQAAWIVSTAPEFTLLHIAFRRPPIGIKIISGCMSGHRTYL